MRAYDVLAFLALTAGIYFVYQADKGTQSKAIYGFVGIATTLWSLFTVFEVRVFGLDALPPVFGLFAVAAVYSKGATKALSGAAALIFFLAIIA